MFSSIRGMIDSLPWFLKPKFAGLAVASGIFLLIVVLGLGFVTRNHSEQLAQATAVMNIISAPTLTQSFPTSQPELSPPEGGTTQENPIGEDIVLDAYVQITGTGGDGLRFRNSASLNGQVKFIASEAEIFIVKDGPVDADGYIWWYLVGPFDEARNGWAVSNYLALAQNPN